MDTVLVEIIDERAYEALRELEKQNVIKLLDKNEEIKEARKSPTAKFRGSLNLTEEQYNDFQNHAQEIRNEWHSDI